MPSAFFNMHLPNASVESRETWTFAWWRDAKLSNDTNNNDSIFFFLPVVPHWYFVCIHAVDVRVCWKTHLDCVNMSRAAALRLCWKRIILLHQVWQHSVVRFAFYPNLVRVRVFVSLNQNMPTPTVPRIGNKKKRIISMSWRSERGKPNAKYSHSDVKYVVHVQCLNPPPTVQRHQQSSNVSEKQPHQPQRKRMACKKKRVSTWVLTIRNHRQSGKRVNARARAYNDETRCILAFLFISLPRQLVYEACQTIFIGEKQHKVSVGIIFYYTSSVERT